jgi:hypothetical protein
MGNNKIIRLINLTVILLVLGGLGASGAFAQGKGRGGGGGNGGGNGHGNGGGWEKHGGGQPGNGRWGGNPAPQQPAQMPQMQNRGWQQRQVIIQPQPQQNRGWQVERRQPQVNRSTERQAWRQQQQPGQNPVYAQPTMPRWNQQPRSAPQMVWRTPSQADWKTERKANRDYLKGLRKEQREMARVPQAPVYVAPQQPYIQRYPSRSQGSYAEPYSYQSRQYQTYREPNYRDYSYQSPAYQNYGYTPQYYGNNGYAPQYGGTYGTNTYVYQSYLPYANQQYADYAPYYYDDLNYNRNTSWKYQLLGMVLQAFLGGRDNYGGYDQNYVGDQYAYYGGSPRYNGYSARYVNYGNRYSGYNDQPYGYGDTEYDAGLFDTVPFFGLTDDFLGGFGNELTMQTLSYGYDQGYSAGQYCKHHSISEDNFYDPYYFEDAGYDPYSVSIGENRRYLSEGYELGFRDGYQAGRRHYNPAEEGDVDLVSLLLNNVLSTV